MPKTDFDPLGEGFKWRLRAELSRITPRYSSPRYLAPGRHRIGAWRFAPAGLAAGLVGMLGLTAYAATGSPNPVVWTRVIVTRIGPNTVPTPSATSEPSEGTSAAGASEHEAQPTTRTEPSERPEPSQRAEPSESPEPRDGGNPPSAGDR